MATNKASRDKIICELYKKNFQVGEIAKKIKINRHTVTRILKKNKIYNKERLKNRLSPDKIKRNENIILMYKSGMSFRNIEKEIGIPHSTAERVVNQYIKDQPIQYSLIVEDKDKLIRHRKYIFNNSYFHTIDCEEKAYWLGFLYADGCITNDAVILTLQANDLKHLIKFRDSLENFTKEPIYRAETNSYCLYFNSKEMINDLKHVGCMSRKTFILRFPTTNQVPTKFIHHFMRGYFDGDGCIYVNPNKSGTNSVNIVGNKNFIDEYKRTLFESINKKNDIKYRFYNNNIVSFTLGGNIQIKKIYNFLYKDATIFLDRKQEKFKTVIGRLKTSSQKSSDDENGIKLENRNVV